MIKFRSISQHFTVYKGVDLSSVASQVALVVKNLLSNAGVIRDEGPIPGLGRSPGGGHGNSLPYSCLENPMDRGASRVQSTGSPRVRDD